LSLLFLATGLLELITLFSKKFRVQFKKWKKDYKRKITNKLKKLGIIKKKTKMSKAKK